jgi:heme oxygenase (mycobilin-producing)
MAHAVLINVFEVPEGQDDAFLAGWEEARQFMAQQPGYISTALHRSLDPAARFRFINIATWESPEAFFAALNHPKFVTMRDSVPFPHYPSVYTVIHED